jgi:phosphatidylinositol transfer protein SFH5
VLEKFLRANGGDVSKAKAQLVEALKWQKSMEPAKLVEAEYESAKFGGLGYVSTYLTAEGKKEIVTWNIYGAVKDVKATFGDVKECVFRFLLLSFPYYSFPLLPNPPYPSKLTPPKTN